MVNATVSLELLFKMPSVRVETNLYYEAFPPQFMTLFVYFLAEIFSKDKNLMKWTFDTDKKMSLASLLKTSVLI